MAEKDQLLAIPHGQLGMGYSFWLGGMMEDNKLAAIQARIAALERLTTVGSAQAVAAWEIVVLLDRIAETLDKIAEHGLLT